MKLYIPVLYGLTVSGVVAYYSLKVAPNDQLLLEGSNNSAREEKVAEPETQLSPNQDLTDDPQLVEAIVVKPQKKLITSINDIIESDPNVVYGELANGMRYILLQNEKPKNNLSLRLHVGAGSLNEDDDQRGVAHFLEHMVFNGTKNYPDSKKLIPMMQRLGIAFGAHANAYTSFDETVYMLDIPNLEKETLDLSFNVMQDFAGGALLEEHEINEERGVILAEKTSRDSVNSRIQQQLYRKLLPDSLMSYRFPIGTKEIIQNVERKRFVDFYTQFYRPKNMCLVCVGDLPVEMMKKRIEDSFSFLQEPNNPGEKPSVGKITTGNGFQTAIFTDKELTSTNLSLTTISPYSQLPDTASNRAKKLPLILANYILSKRFSNLLLEKPQTPILSGYASRSVAFKQIEFGNIGVTAKNSDWRSALPVMIKEFKTALDHGFTEQELQEVQSIILTSYENRVKSKPSRKSPSLASSLVSNYHNNTVFSTPEQDLHIISEALSNITKESCHTAFKAFWATPDISLTLTTPKKTKKMEQALASLFKREIAKETQAPISETDAIFAYTDFGKAGTVVKEEFIEDLDITQLTLSNNIRVNLKKTDFSKNSISLLATINGGNLAVPKELAGFSQFATSIRNGSGLSKHAPTELNRLLAGKTVHSSFSIGGSTFNYSGSTTQDDLELQLQVLTASIIDPAFRAEAETRFRSQLPQVYKEMQYSASGGHNKITKLLNANDARFYQPQQEVFSNYSTASVKSWLTPLTAKNYMELSIVGDFDIKQLKPALLKTIGALPQRNASPQDYSKHGILPKVKLPKEQNFTYQSKIDSATIISAWPYTFDKYDQRTVRRLSILSKILNDRLRVKLREDLGQAYSPGATTSINRYFKNNSYLLAYCPTKPSDVIAINKAIIEIAESIAQDGATEDELKRALTPVVSEFDKSLKSNHYWLYSVMAHSQARPEQIGWSRSRTEDFNSITLQEINVLAKEILNSKNVSQFSIQSKQ